MVLVTTTAGVLRTTRGHPQFWIVGKGWRMAKELNVGDRRRRSLGGGATSDGDRETNARGSLQPDRCRFRHVFRRRRPGSCPRQYAPPADTNGDSRLRRRRSLIGDVGAGSEVRPIRRAIGHRNTVDLAQQFLIGKGRQSRAPALADFAFTSLASATAGMLSIGAHRVCREINCTPPGEAL